MTRSLFQNDKQLTDHGERALRKDALAIADFALTRANPYRATKELVHLEGDCLVVGEDRFSLSSGQKIFVHGAGKATFPMAKALDEILGERITDGVVIVKYDQDGVLSHMRLFHSGHPIPDENGLAAGKASLELVDKVGNGDIFFSITTGGSTAMMPCPVEGVTLADKQKTGELLLKSGASMWEMNYVRSHLTRLKFGLMGKRLPKEAHIINLGVADGIGQTVEDCVDTTTACFFSFDDARGVLTKYGLWDQVPSSVADYLRNGTEEQEIPRDLKDHRLYNHLLVEVNDAVEAAAEKATAMGYHTSILSTYIEGDSRQLGDFLGSIALEIKHHDRPIPKPACLIVGGESMQLIHIPNPGEGGPSQQLALALSAKIDGEQGIAALLMDTDGSDGPTPYAGGLVDGKSFAVAQEKNMDVFSAMDAFADSPVLCELGDALQTGATGTNVNDLRIVLIK